MSMSLELQDFYRDIDLWLRKDEASTYTFRADFGLCDNLAEWSIDKGWEEDTFLYELHQQLRDAGLSMPYPFNKDADDYEKESNSFGTYCNKARLDWVKARMQQIKKEER